MRFNTLLAQAYYQACDIELRAFKPGNVSVYADGHDMTVADFRRSAEISAAALTDITYTLGEKIYYAVAATRAAVGCNTNLGIILLCAPLLQAAQQIQSWQTLRQALALVLNNTTQNDAAWVFKAICLAAPGGLGDSSEQDVKQQAQVTLTEAMAIAEDRDRIAFQYTHNYKDIFDFSVLEYNRAFVLSDDQEWSALLVYCRLLSRFADSHIERKYGEQYTAWVQAEMATLYGELCAASGLEQVLPKLYRLDKAFKDQKINPGTTADLTVATVLVALLDKILETKNAVMLQ